MCPIPDEFVCPISQLIMRDAVLTSDGHSYEQEWVADLEVSPFNREKLESGRFPNLQLRDKIREFIAANPEYAKDVAIPRRLWEELAVAIGKNDLVRIRALIKLEPRLVTLTHAQSVKDGLTKNDPKITPSNMLAEMHAIKANNLELVNFFRAEAKLPPYTSLNLAERFPEVERNQAFLAAIVANAPISELEKLFALGVDIESFDDEGNTLLQVAVKQNNEEIVAWLLAKGSLFTKNFTGTTAMHYAVMNNNVRMIKLLQVHGASLTDVSLSGHSVLHYAAFNLAFEAMQYLLNANPNLQVKNNNGKTPIHFLASATKGDATRKIQMIELLLNFGVSIDAEDKAGMPALCYVGDKAVAVMLVQRGAKIGFALHHCKGNVAAAILNTADRNECIKAFLLNLRHPLASAVHCNDIEFVKACLEFGIAPSEVSLVDCYQRSLLLLATYKAGNEIVQLLLDAGAELLPNETEFEYSRTQISKEMFAKILAARSGTGAERRKKFELKLVPDQLNALDFSKKETLIEILTGDPALLKLLTTARNCEIQYQQPFQFTEKFNREKLFFKLTDKSAPILSLWLQVMAENPQKKWSLPSTIVVDLNNCRELDPQLFVQFVRVVALGAQVNVTFQVERPIEKHMNLLPFLQLLQEFAAGSAQQQELAWVYQQLFNFYHHCYARAVLNVETKSALLHAISLCVMNKAFYIELNDRSVKAWHYLKRDEIECLYESLMPAINNNAVYAAILQHFKAKLVLFMRGYEKGKLPLLAEKENALQKVNTFVALNAEIQKFMSERSFFFRWSEEADWLNDLMNKMEKMPAKPVAEVVTPRALPVSSAASTSSTPVTTPAVAASQVGVFRAVSSSSLQLPNAPQHEPGEEERKTEKKLEAAM